MKRNPAYDPAAAAGAAMIEWHHFEPANLEPDYFLPQLLGGRAFYSKAEVILDGVRIDQPNMDEQGESLNANFVTFLFF